MAGNSIQGRNSTPGKRNCYEKRYTSCSLDKFDYEI